MAKKRQHSPEFRVEIVERMLAGENVMSLAKQHGLARSMMYRWRDAYRRWGAGEVANKSNPPRRQVEGDSKAKLRQQIAELERTIGRQAVEIDFFKGVFKRLKESPKAQQRGGEASTRRSGE
jgi:transposase